MKQAGRIRQFALDHYVALARVGGRSEITIRAGDVHQAMGLANAMPAVCSAIGSNKFNELASVTPGARTGPANGANIISSFMSLLIRRGAVTTRQHEPLLRPAHSRPSSNFDLGDALVLVSCVKSKLAHAAPARALYSLPPGSERCVALSRRVARVGSFSPHATVWSDRRRNCRPMITRSTSSGSPSGRTRATDVLRELLPEVETTGVRSGS